MVKNLLALTIVSLAMFTPAATAWGAEVEVADTNGVIYTVDTTSKTAMLKTVPWNESFSALIIPDDIEYDGVAYPVTSVGERAGETCARFITSVTLGANVTRLDDLAFRACENITEVVFNDKLKEIGASAFYGCRLVGEFNLPEGLESIGYYAFYNCQNIKQANIPSTVKSIGGNPWGSCSLLTKFNLAEGNQYFKLVNDVLFDKDVTRLISYPIGKPDNSYTVPSTVKVIGDNSMRNNSNLSYIYFNDGLERIEGGAFNVCNLRKVEIPASVTELGERVFTSNPNISEFVVAAGNKNYKTVNGFLCTIDGSHLIQGLNVADVVIPDEVQYVDGYAFYRFNNIKTVKLSNAKSIGYASFYNCGQLKSVDFGTSLEAIGNMSFMTCPQISEAKMPATLKVLGGQAFTMCSMLETLELNNGLEEIGDAACAYCYGIKSIKFPASIKKIGQGCFTNCTSLTYAEFEEGIERIPDMTLSHCGSLKKVVMPDCVKEIGQFAFGYCSALTDVNIPASLEIVRTAAFEFVPITELIMPENLHTVQEFGFAYCDLRSIQACPALKELGQYAFGSNKNLSTVVLNEGLETIDEGAFGFSDKLLSFTIPASVVNLGPGVLVGSMALSSIENKAVEPQELTNDFVNSSVLEKCKLIVPAQSLDKYKSAAYWCNFSHIVPDGAGVEAVGIDAEPVAVGYYDSKGAFSSEPVDGVNIVRYSDGSVKKVFYSK